MTDNTKIIYAELALYAETRSKELTPLLGSYIDITDRYGEVICGIVDALGKTPPTSARDAAARDLIADVFDFLYEARPLIIKGKLEVAYPLARRAYKSLSLLVSGKLEPTLIDRWISGDQISHSQVRRVLAAHPGGEEEVKLENFIIFFVRRPTQTEATCLTGFWEKETSLS